LEISPPPPEQYYITTGKKSDGKKVSMLNTRSKTGRDHYQHFFDQHHQQVRELMRKQKIPLFQLSTNDDLLLKIQQNLGQSRQRASSFSSSITPAKVAT